ncbi:hypothetical protein [Stackebrandtia albiflava]|uniref:hypothetical protein n=1 Tax=Stackebrandtia albiflava TaxID=406432 RepID=UPI00131518B3|nr:hypothetical protein [Stackebrandtia albiflava]
MVSPFPSLLESRRLREPDDVTEAPAPEAQPPPTGTPKPRRGRVSRFLSRGSRRSGDDGTVLDVPSAEAAERPELRPVARARLTGRPVTPTSAVDHPDVFVAADPAPSVAEILATASVSGARGGLPAGAEPAPATVAVPDEVEPASGPAPAATDRRYPPAIGRAAVPVTRAIGRAAVPTTVPAGDGVEESEPGTGDESVTPDGAVSPDTEDTTVIAVTTPPASAGPVSPADRRPLRTFTAAVPLPTRETTAPVAATADAQPPPVGETSAGGAETLSIQDFSPESPAPEVVDPRPAGAASPGDTAPDSATPDGGTAPHGGGADGRPRVTVTSSDDSGSILPPATEPDVPEPAAPGRRRDGRPLARFTATRPPRPEKTRTETVNGGHSEDVTGVGDAPPIRGAETVTPGS